MKESDRNIDYFKRNCVAYALALESNNLSDKEIKKGLVESGWYDTKQIQFAMSCMIQSRREK